MISDSGSHIPVRVDEKKLAEKDRRPLATSFDRLVDVNLALTEQVKRLVSGVWVFMVIQVVLHVVNVALARK